MAVDLAPSSKRNRTRSPSYPYIDLAAALEKAAALWRAEGRHAASVAVVMQHWGYKEESSTGYSCVAALKKFGLVDHEGMGETRQVRLSNLALRILLDDDPQSAERRAALRDAALGPRIHAELWERYGVDLPSDPSLKRFLILERSFNEAVVDELLAGYKATMAFAGLARAGSGAAPAVNNDPPPPAAGAVPRLPVSPVPGAAVPIPAVPPVQSATAAGPALTLPTFASDDAERERRVQPPRTLPPRAVGPPAAATGASLPPVAQPATLPPAAVPRATPPAQHDLFGERAAAEYVGASLEEEAFPSLRPSSSSSSSSSVSAPPRDPEGAEAGGGPWSMPRRELPVPLDNGLTVRVPYPMSEEDFALLMDTLQLWKKRLVRPLGRSGL